MAMGKAYLVGAGPGDPRLMTIAAREAIESADVIAYDCLVDEGVLSWARGGCEKIYVGKRAGYHTIDQSKINELLVEKASAGKTVVRLKGGDPFVFGRGGEELRALTEAGARPKIIPGVTAALAAAADAGLPLTHRDFASSFTVVTGHENHDKTDLLVDFRELARTADSLCVYMGMGRLSRIADELMKGGMPEETPAAIVQWAGTARSRCVRSSLGRIVSEAQAQGFGAPAVVFVGPAASFSQELADMSDLPLSGKRIAVTRSGSQASELSARLTEAGAQALEMPLIHVESAIDKAAADDVFAEIGTYEWLVFTSPNGVRFFMEAFLARFSDIRCLGLARIASIGKGTSRALAEYHLKPDLEPAQATSDALAEALREEQTLDNLKALLIVGDRNRDALAKSLEEERAIVDTLQVYRNRPTDLAEHPAAKEFRKRGADAIVFASGSAVRNFVSQAKSLALEAGAQPPKGVSIGPVTSAAMVDAGIPVSAQAKEHSLDGVIETLKELFAGG